MRRRTAVPALVLALGLAVAGCTTQPKVANDNGPQPDPVQPTGVVQLPVPVETAPLTVPLPGESNSPNVGPAASPAES